jgi:MFS family permease
MLAALAVFLSATIFCAVSPSVEILVIARVAQGIGGGGLMTLSQALISVHVPPRERARYQSLLSTTAVSSTAFGAVAGGWLTQHCGWRSVFLVTVPIGLVAMLLLRRLPAFAHEREPFRFDVLGLFLFVVFVTASLLALHQVQEWRSEVVWTSLALITLAVAAISLLVWRENRLSYPLLPIPLFRDSAIWRSDLMALCHGAILVSLVTFLPIYLRVGHGANATQIGLSLLPITVGVPLGSITTGLLIVWTGRTAIFPSLGLIVVVLTLGTVGLLLPTLDVLELTSILGFCALFMGTVMGVVQLTTQASAGTNMRGTAAASVQFSRSIGATWEQPLSLQCCSQP